MNGPEFASLRAALNISAALVAEQLGVTRRTVVRWEAGDGPVPDDAAADLEALAQRLEWLEDHAAQHLVEVDAAGGDPVLRTYRSEAAHARASGTARLAPSAAAHRAACARVAQRLVSMGIDVRIAYTEPLSARKQPAKARQAAQEPI